MKNSSRGKKRCGEIKCRAGVGPSQDPGKKGSIKRERAVAPKPKRKGRRHQEREKLA